MKIKELEEILNKIPSLKGKIKYLEKLILNEKDKKIKKELIKILFTLSKKTGKRFTFEELSKKESGEIREIEISKEGTGKEVEEIGIGSESKDLEIDEFHVGIQELIQSTKSEKAPLHLEEIVTPEEKSKEIKKDYFQKFPNIEEKLPEETKEAYITSEQGYQISEKKIYERELRKPFLEIESELAPAQVRTFQQKEEKPEGYIPVEELQDQMKKFFEKYKKRE